jgi:AcrR family transcriptional regulator
VARPTHQLLSRESIGTAAIDLVDSGKELQVLPLAEKLGVSVSSLYHHVQGRTGIIRAMRDVLIQRTNINISHNKPWEETLREYAHAYWRMFAGHPRVLLLLLTVEISESESLEMYRTLIIALRDAGLAEDALLTTIEVIDAFIFGVVLDLLSPETIFDPNVEDADLARLISAHPRGAKRNQLVNEHGLDILIAGIRAQLSSS